MSNILTLKHTIVIYKVKNYEVELTKQMSLFFKYFCYYVLSNIYNPPDVQAACRLQVKHIYLRGYKT